MFSFECGGRTYAIGPNGTVIAGDSARSRFELRVTDRSSDDALGNDADRVEFRFRDANNRIDLKCARTSVPATWLADGLPHQWADLDPDHLSVPRSTCSGRGAGADRAVRSAGRSSQRLVA